MMAGAAILAVAHLALAQAVAPAALSPAAQAFVADATDRLIAGDDLAPDFPVRLQELPPDERLMVIVHLRRAGFLNDIVLPVDWVLSPATTQDAAAGARR